MPAFNIPLTLATIRGYVRNLILERAGDVGLITDAEANDLVNLAARIIFVRIANKYPDVFAQRSATNITVSNATMGVPFTSIVSGGASAGHLFRILNAQAGAVGATLGQLDQVSVFSRAADRHIYEHSNSGTGFFAAPAIPARFYVEGQTVYFTPITSGSFDCRFQWVQQPQDMTADADTLWGGFLPQYGDLVGILAASLAVSKDGQAQTPVDKFLQYVDQILVEQFGPPANPYEEQPAEMRP